MQKEELGDKDKKGNSPQQVEDSGDAVAGRS